LQDVADRNYLKLSLLEFTAVIAVFSFHNSSSGNYNVSL